MFSGTDPYRPSFFEMVAQDRLISGLKPALQHIMTSLSRRHPIFTPCVTYHEELFTSLVYLLERHYLKQYDASFAESFYGLKRIRYISGISLDTLQNRSIVTLTSHDRSRALFVLVVIPYIHRKLELIYKRGTEGAIGEDGFQQLVTSSDLPPFLSHLHRLFLRIYPYFSATYELIAFLYQLRYLFEYTPYYSIWHYILGQTVRRLTMEDMMSQQSQSPRPRLSIPLDSAWSSSRLSFFYRLRSMLSRLTYIVADYAKWGILIAIFAAKFTEWWYSPQNRLSQATQLPIPPPPQPAKPSASGIPIPSDPTLCPLCLRSRTNPACPPSGYVYCYPCLFHHITSHGMCPITRITCGVEQIRKIYQT